MNISAIKPGPYETLAYTTLILGVIGDHVSTSLALSRNGFQEANPVALNLMNNGLWIKSDVILILLLMTLPVIATRIAKSPMNRMFLVPLFIAGIIRLLVTLSNVSLLIR